MKIKVNGTRPSKINIKGKIQNFWILQRHFHENQGQRDRFGLKKIFGPKTTILILFTPRKQLLAIF